jgi:hypothetical protein
MIFRTVKYMYGGDFLEKSKGEYFEKYKVCVKEGDKHTHHPRLILNGGYPPAGSTER